ncbi:MAG: hypothetical protein BWY22_00728 [Bacteroidetes bacterium ADurb.Bin217]|nr:MAG: hypothetical protein BWY22_00728 [Bacteroidetes bacterium ADurb.Bin217]
MDCTKCNTKQCRTGTACKATKSNADDVRAMYHEPHNQTIVQAAAQLVDNGRAGSLSRMQEIVEFAKTMQYKNIGLAYCYGMEVQAAEVTHYFRNAGLSMVPVSCTVGAHTQADVNQQSCIHKVSCNPLSQAAQMQAEGVDFAITMGLCLGHDILFNKYIGVDVTTLLVKDRVYNHQPLQELNTK